MQNLSNDLDGFEDGELVFMAQRGDDQAFTELIRRHQSSCLKLAISVLRDLPDAEDQVQNSFWNAFEHIGQFQGESKFSTWLGRIVVNQCLMRLRQKKRAKAFFVDDAVFTELEPIHFPAEIQTPEESFGRQEVAWVLHKEISCIPPLLRHVFLLRDVQQLPMPEVAHRLGISISAAKSRLLRSRSELRLRMAKYECRRGVASFFV